MKKLVSLLIALLMIVSMTAGAEENGLPDGDSVEIQTGTAAESDVSAAPENGELPAEVPEVAEGAEPTAVSETTEVPEVAESSEPAAVLEAAEVPEAAEGAESVVVSEAADLSEAAEAADFAAIPEITEITESTETPEATEAAGITEAAEPAAVPEAAANPEQGEIAENGDAAEIAETEPETAAVSEGEAVIPEAQAESEPIILEAVPEGEAVIPEAASESEPVIPEAEPGNEPVIPEAQAESEPIISEAASESEAVISEAASESEPVISEAVPEGEAVIPEAQPESEPVIPEAEPGNEPVIPEAESGSEPVIPETEPESVPEEGNEPEAPAEAQEAASETTDVLSAATEAEVQPEIPYEADELADVLEAATAEADVLAMSDYADQDSARGFVYRLYSTVLQRTPDESGFRYWVNMLDSGQKTAAEVIDDFFNSDEYTHSGKSNDQIVSDCYNTMLNRNPDESGFEYWKNRLDIGMTPQSILAGFVGSEEFTRLAYQYGVVRGDITITNPLDKNYERTYFIYRLYQNCLSRTPDRSGQAGWCVALENGLTGSQIASGFFFSEEFNKNRYNNSTFVQTLYKAIMGREYDVDGLIEWTTKLNYSDTREKVLNGFIGSEEFVKQCQKAEILPGDPIYTPDDTEEWKYNIRVLALCNDQRRLAGLADLYTREDLLWDLAMARAEEITQVFSHTRPDGSEWKQLFREQGFYGYQGENLAVGTVYRDPAEVVEAWMNSAGHRANIMNENYKYLATGLINDPEALTYCGEGKYMGQYRKFGTYSAQSFCSYGVKIP